MENLTKLIQNALEEDLGEIGDITSIATISENQSGCATIIAKQDGIVAGGFVVEKVFSIVDTNVIVNTEVSDGSFVKKGQHAFTIEGPLRSILTGERTALNFLCRLSGIATLSYQFCEKVKHTKLKILDTRKTTPGLRWLEKYAVRTGGATNHRIGLYDMILLKENHIAAAGGIEKAVSLCRNYMKSNNLNLKIEVETQTLEQVQQALAIKVDRIMLDNMNLEQIKQAVHEVDNRIELEISGGVNMENIKEYAETGADFVSIGFLTHSPKAFDFSLLLNSLP